MNFHKDQNLFKVALGLGAWVALGDLNNASPICFELAGPETSATLSQCTTYSSSPRLALNRPWRSFNKQTTKMSSDGETFTPQLVLTDELFKERVELTLPRK